MGGLEVLSSIGGSSPMCCSSFPGSISDRDADYVAVCSMDEKPVRLISKRKHKHMKYLNLTILLLLSSLSAAAQPAKLDRGKPFLEVPKPLPHRVFASSKADVDKVLARPYDSDVPFGSSGDRLWATSPQGWAFREGV